MVPARLRRQLVSALLALSILVALAPPWPALAAAGDTSADGVLGQADMAGHTANAGGSVSAVVLDSPNGVAVDPVSGRLYVADFANNRVLGWPDSAAFTNGQAADLVLGQTNFSNHAANRGGSPSALTLASPAGLAVDDRTGNLYVSDFGNNRILEFTAPITSDLAASRVFGQGGSFATANANKDGISHNSLDGPRGLAIEDNGQLFVADSLNNRVLVYNPDGDTTADRVLGQNGSFNTAGANAGSLTVSAGGFDEPFALAVQGSDDDDVQNSTLAVVDHNNNRVLLFQPATNQTAIQVYGQGGSFSAHGGNNGGPGPDSLSDPRGAAFDSAQDLYVADFGNNRVLRYSAGGSDLTAHSVLGQGASFTTTMANKTGFNADGLSGPLGLAVDPAQNVMVADSGNHRVLRFDRPQDNPAPAIADTSPDTVAVGGFAFKLVVYGSGFVRGSVVQWESADRPTSFISPSLIVATINASDITTNLGGSVTVVNPGPGGGLASKPVPLYFGLRGDEQADGVLGQPNFVHTTAGPNQLHNLSARSLSEGVTGAAVDPQTGRLYVADTGNSRVLSWPNAAAFTNAQPADLVLGQTDMASAAHSGGSTHLTEPGSVAVDPAGNVYVADSDNSRVLEFNSPATTDTVADRVFGQASMTGTAQNTSGVNQFGLALPFGVALDAQGNLYVADSGNNRVLIYDAPLTSDTAADAVLGQTGFTTNAPNEGNATPSANGLSLPAGLAFDSAGRLYVADFFNSRVLVYPAGASTGAAAIAVFGQPNLSSGAINNPAVGPNSLNRPAGVAVDRDGNVYLADSGNNRLLEYNDPFSSGGNFTADRVFGQANFTSNTANAINAASKTSLSNPTMLALDAQADLFVTDAGNARLLQYLTPVAQKLRLELPLVTK